MIAVRQIIANFAVQRKIKAVGRSVAGTSLVDVQEESPGSIEHSTSENRSSLRRLSNVEENNRQYHYW